MRMVWLAIKFGRVRAGSGMSGAVAMAWVLLIMVAIWWPERQSDVLVTGNFEGKPGR